MTPKHEERIYEKLREKLRVAIKNKAIKELERLLPKAIDKFPMELEQLICHAEFVIKKFRESEQQELLSDNVYYEYEYDSEYASGVTSP